MSPPMGIRCTPGDELTAQDVYDIWKIRDAVFAVVEASMSPSGFELVRNLMRINGFLGDLVEMPMLMNEFSYNFALYGEPSETEPWGCQLFGHHVALNYTIGAGGEVSASPLFLGANPALTRLVGPGVLRPLAAEEDLARELLDALAPDQLATATLSESAPGDILQTNRPAVRVGPPEGLAAAGMLPQQRALLAGLLDQYLGRLPAPLAELEGRRVAGELLEAVHFGWAGGREPGQPHYYRIQGPRLHIEYDNVQNGANHVHSVWRDPEGDFGQSSTG